jgi:hypothetical protein
VCQYEWAASRSGIRHRARTGTAAATERDQGGAMRLRTALLISTLLVASGAKAAGAAASGPPIVLAVAADMRSFAGPGEYDSASYFRGACEAMAAVGGVSCLISPGDVDPPAGVRWTLDAVLGASFPWYPAVGNHDAETPADMAWLRAFNPQGTALPGAVNPGPAQCRETTYSFDLGPAHVAVLDEYCGAGAEAAVDGDVGDTLYDWLAADLRATAKPQVFVVGHEPAWVRPDAENGTVRHLGSSLDRHPEHRDRFWGLLAERGVRAYLNGHTHCFSVTRVAGVWQIDVGHARGDGDTGTRSTFVILRLTDRSAGYEAYRAVGPGGAYAVVESGSLAGPQRQVRRALRPISR